MNNELLKRSITGILIVGLTLAAVMYSSYSYVAFLSLIAFFGTREFLRLEQSIFRPFQLILFPLMFAFIVGYAGFSMITTYDPVPVIMILPLLVPCIIITQFVAEVTAPELVQQGKMLFTAMIYICIPLLTGCIFLSGNYSFQFILVPIILIWVNDVGAYLIGSKWGTKKIMPLISPGKSVQGTLGGGFFALLAAILLMWIWPELPKGYLIMLGVGTPVFALGGDLWESALKRNAGVKDSGAILPGHGGILDRYDSLLFVMPVAALAYFIFAV